MAEWSKAHAWKVCRRETVSRVRIPLAPPLALAKAFSRSGCGRIFPLFSRVMREGLSTGPCARRPESVLSGPIFSGPHDCADLVNFLYGIEKGWFCRGYAWTASAASRARCLPAVSEKQHGRVATLTAWAELRGIPYEGVPVGTIKRHATGKGNAAKEAMIAAARARGFSPLMTTRPMRSPSCIGPSKRTGVSPEMVSPWLWWRAP